MFREQLTFLTLILIAHHEVFGLSHSEKMCLNFYKTGHEYNLTELVGDWHAVYFWPPNPRLRDSCERINFRTIGPDFFESENGCEIRDDAFQKGPIVEGKFENAKGKPVTLVFYGEREVKNLIRSCFKSSVYLFQKLNADYVLGINCSSGGRAVLLCRHIPERSIVDLLIEDRHLMVDRPGSPDCDLDMNRNYTLSQAALKSPSQDIDQY